MVIMVLLLLSLSMTVTFSCFFRGCFIFRGLDTVRITKVMVHVDNTMVLVREDDRLGNDAADEAADIGRREGWKCCH